MGAWSLPSSLWLKLWSGFMGGWHWLFLQPWQSTQQGQCWEHGGQACVHCRTSVPRSAQDTGSPLWAPHQCTGWSLTPGSVPSRL